MRRTTGKIIYKKVITKYSKIQEVITRNFIDKWFYSEYSIIILNLLE